MFNLLIASPIVTSLSSQGNNYATLTFRNNETYKFYFYINAYDTNLYMSIFDIFGNVIMEDRQIILSTNLFGDTQLQGKISVIGLPPTIQTIDNTCNIFYNYFTS